MSKKVASKDKLKLKDEEVQILKLLYPIDWDSEDGLVTELEFKRPKGKHLKGLTSELGLAEIFKIASKITGFTPAFFDEMDGADCLRVSELIGTFLEAGPKTTKTN